MAKKWASQILMICFITAPLSAMAMPSSLTFTCRNLVGLINARGAVVLSTGPGLFDRYVSSGKYCEVGLEPLPAWVPTQDTTQCFVGAICTLPRSGTN